jgi:hypothetical protein
MMSITYKKNDKKRGYIFISALYDKERRDICIMINDLQRKQIK